MSGSAAATFNAEAEAAKFALELTAEELAAPMERLKLPQVSDVLTEPPLPKEFSQHKLSELGGYFSKWREIPNNFVRNYHAKYIAKGSPAPLLHMALTAFAIGYAFDFSHLREHKARREHH
mmetsp:Transcript_4752/g.8153  ORF Transcript_4752/g.8153 Transcript_4752/m.8153 type:complete len:121 (-) Transcript_4752:265-627(-)